jgi:phosphoribosylformimino-5-aminoimidazole carboxamide ribotide isomerase
MFEIVPCVDVLGGRAVRLEGGDPARATTYYDAPADAAAHWASLGATTIHFVDLDAALERGDNAAAIAAAAARAGVGSEIGGGVRSRAAADAWLTRVDRVVLGTAAIDDPDLVDALVREHGAERIVVSLDAKHGRVAVRGWRDVRDVLATDVAADMAARGVTRMIYTDVVRDGTLQGVDEAPVAAMRAAFPHRLWAGGGVARDADVATYERLGLDGAIVGRALYEGTIRYPRTT